MEVDAEGFVSQRGKRHRKPAAPAVPGSSVSPPLKRKVDRPKKVRRGSPKEERLCLASYPPTMKALHYVVERHQTATLFPVHPSTPLQYCQIGEKLFGELKDRYPNEIWRANGLPNAIIKMMEKKRVEEERGVMSVPTSPTKAEKRKEELEARRVVSAPASPVKKR